jgi:hypothetical protein
MALPSRPILTKAYDHVIARYPDVEIEEYEDRNLFNRIFAYGKGDRANILLELEQTQPMADMDASRLTLDVWQGVEFPIKQSHTWVDLWNNYMPCIPPEQQGRIKELFAEPRTVYRGGSKDGWSWTLDKEQARWFATNRSMFSPMVLKDDPYLIPQPQGLWSKQVSASDVLAVMDYELEVILKYDPDDPGYYGGETIELPIKEKVDKHSNR